MATGAEKKPLVCGKKYFQYLIYNYENSYQMHSALRVFYQISRMRSTDFSAVANIDLFPGTQSMFLCSVSGILNLLRSANTHVEQCSSLCGRLHCTHIYAHVGTAQIFLSSLLRTLRNLSVICGWLELVSDLQKLTILLTTSSSFPECRVGGDTCPALLKRHIRGHKYFYQTHKIQHSSTTSKTKNMNNLTKINQVRFSLYSPCKIVTETKETDFDDSDYQKKK